MDSKNNNVMITGEHQIFNFYFNEYVGSNENIPVPSERTQSNNNKKINDIKVKLNSDHNCDIKKSEFEEVKIRLKNATDQIDELKTIILKVTNCLEQTIEESRSKNKELDEKCAELQNTISLVDEQSEEWTCELSNKIEILKKINPKYKAVEKYVNENLDFEIDEHDLPEHLM